MGPFDGADGLKNCQYDREKDGDAGTMDCDGGKKGVCNKVDEDVPDCEIDGKSVTWKTQVVSPNGAKCNTHDRSVTDPPPSGDPISTFNNADMRALFTDQCGRNKQHYPISEHKDFDKPGDTKTKIRLNMVAKTEGGKSVKFDEGGCVDNFAKALDGCGDLGGEITVDGVTCQVYAFETGK
ncbi:MAG: hypothetical protein Q9170_007428 [Blastenia crenularia]